LLHQQRKIAAVVNVRMREHHAVQLLCRQCQMLIDLTSLLPMSLKQPTVRQHILSRAFQMVRRARNRLCRTPKNAVESPFTFLLKTKPS
jgi:hypothetical protein